MKKLFEIANRWKVLSLDMFKRKHSNKDKTKFEIPIVRYLVYLLILTLAVSGVSLSRYSVSSGTIQSGRVAKLAGTFTHGGTWTGEYDDIYVLPTGENGKNYNFTIENDSEVAMRVRIINKFNDLPLDSTYYSVSVTDENGDSVGVDGNGWFDFSPAGSGADTRHVTIWLSTTDVTTLKIYFQYQQID